MLETAAGDYPPPVETETHLVSAEQQWNRKERNQSSHPRCTQLHHPDAAAPPESHVSCKKWVWMVIRRKRKIQRGLFLLCVPHHGWTIKLCPQISTWCSRFPLFYVPHGHVKKMTKVNWSKLSWFWSLVKIPLCEEDKQDIYYLLNPLMDYVMTCRNNAIEKFDFCLKCHHFKVVHQQNRSNQKPNPCSCEVSFKEL